MTRYISIRQAKKDESLPARMHFSGIRFIDNRLDTSSIGVRYDFSFSSLYKINLRDQLSTINAYIRANYGNDFQNDKDSILAVVNDLRVAPAINARFTFKETQLVGMKLLLACKHGDRITIIGNDDTLLAFRRVHPARYATTIKKALKTVLIRADDLVKNMGPSRETLTEEQFTGRYMRINAFDYPILKDSGLNKGFFPDFHQFAANSPQQEIPDELPGYEEEGIPSEASAKNSFATVDSNAIWGYCDGKNMYVRTRFPAAFYPLKRNTNHFDVNVRTVAAKAAYEPPKAHAGTAETIVKVVVVIVFIVAIAYLARNSKSTSTPDLGSFSSGGSYPGPMPAIPPEITVTVANIKYRVSVTRINMQTGILDF